MLYFMEYEAMGTIEDREMEHILGRKLLAYGLKEEYGKDYKIEQAEGGKPYLLEAPHIFFNISHTRGMVVCGVSEREIGVDVEYVREAKENLIQRVCSKEERKYIWGEGDMEEKRKLKNDKIDKMEGINLRFTRIWTLKESYGKAIGKGLAFSMKENSFSLEESKKGIIVGSNIEGWNYRQFMLRRKYVVSVCEENR